MIGLISPLLFSLFFNLSVSSYRSIFTAEAKGNLSSTFFLSSNMEIEKDIRTNRERKHLLALFVGNFTSFIRIKGNFDRTVENIGGRGGESKGGLIEAGGYKRGFLIRVYVEGRRYERDSAFVNPGFGFLLSKQYKINKLRNNVHLEYRSFGDFKSSAASYRAVNGSNDSEKINYGFGVDLRKRSLPYGLVSVDTRFLGKGYGEVSLHDTGKMLKLSVNYTSSNSVKVASMNYRMLEGRAIGDMVLIRELLKTSSTLQYTKKTFFDGGYESQWNYKVHADLSYRTMGVQFKAHMKRFNYFSLVPLDRDERTVSMVIGIMNYRISLERIDINYIRSQYVSNSKSMKRFVISSKVHSLKVKDLILGYRGRLFAGISTPIYSDDMGYYQRYWDNSFSTIWKDSALVANFEIKYKQMGEFKNDSIYAPYEDVEYVEGLKYRIFSGSRVEVYAEQSACVSEKTGVREWKAGIYLNTGAYTAQFGMGELMGRKNTYLEFSAWI